MKDEVFPTCFRNVYYQRGFDKIKFEITTLKAPTYSHFVLCHKQNCLFALMTHSVKGLSSMNIFTLFIFIPFDVS